MKHETDFGSRGRALWLKVHEDFELAEQERELLVEVCRTLDSLDELEEASHPAIVDGKVNPALKEARAQRVVAGRLLAQLSLPGLDDEEAIASPASQRARKAAQARWQHHEKRS